MKKLRSLAPALLLAVVSAPSLLAQTEDDTATIGKWSVIPLAGFNPTRSTTTFGVASDGSTSYHARTSSDGWFHAPFGLPAGSQVHELCVFAYDNSAAAELAMGVVFTELGEATHPAIIGLRADTAVFTGVAATPGYVRACALPSGLVLNTYGDPSGDGSSGWLSWAIQVVPGTGSGAWPQIGWGGVAIRSSPPVN
jgi:hypothetical protein